MNETFEQGMKDWEALGMESVNIMFAKLHDHGWVETKNGLVPLPSGEVGEVCKTCGKVIDPFTHEP